MGAAVWFVLPCFQVIIEDDRAIVFVIKIDWRVVAAVSEELVDGTEVFTDRLRT